MHFLLVQTFSLGFLRRQRGNGRHGGSLHLGRRSQRSRTRSPLKFITAFPSATRDTRTTARLSYAQLHLPVQATTHGELKQGKRRERSSVEASPRTDLSVAGE